MSANKYKLPELETSYDSYVNRDYQEVDDWFKRCTDDCPTYLAMPHAYDISLWRKWYEKWFSQFRNKSDK